MLATPVTWLSLGVVFCLTLATLASGYVVTVLYIRPMLSAAERAALAADQAAIEMETAAKEMQKAALLMQLEIPVTTSDMRKTSEEFELLGKQLNFLLGLVTKPVRQPVEWVERAAETTSGATITITQRLASDTSSLANVSSFVCGRNEGDCAACSMYTCLGRSQGAFWGDQASTLCTLTL
jgi:hypothetical protein